MNISRSEGTAYCHQPSASASLNPSAKVLVSPTAVLVGVRSRSTVKGQQEVVVRSSIIAKTVAGVMTEAGFKGAARPIQCNCRGAHRSTTTTTSASRPRTRHTPRPPHRCLLQVFVFAVAVPSIIYKSAKWQVLVPVQWLMHQTLAWS